MTVKTEGSVGITFPDGSVQSSAAIPSQLAPAGMIADFAMQTAPAGWLACDGTAISRTTYAALFAAIGTIWGAGDGSTTFNVPNFATGDAAIQGTVGTNSNGQMPSHSHQTFPAGWASAASGGTVMAGNGVLSATSSAGSGTRNLAAGRGVQKCIKV